MALGGLDNRSAVRVLRRKGLVNGGAGDGLDNVMAS